MSNTKRRALLLLRGSMAFIWIETAVVSAVFSPRLGLELLESVGLHGALARAVMYGTCGFELLLGLLLLSECLTRLLALLQALLIFGFTVIISVAPGLRTMWLHPFGPIAKNLPLLGGVAVLWAFSDHPSKSRDSNRERLNRIGRER
jgi:uncharacterized membrane protein YphA (DoxX/SURF4 family)